MYCICDLICLRYSLKYATLEDFISWLIYKKSLYPYVHMLSPVHSNGTSPYHKLNIPSASLAPEWRAAWCAAVPAPDPRLNVTRQGVGCLGCKLYDLILRCFTTRFQFFVYTLVGKWCVPSDLCPAGRLFHLFSVLQNTNTSIIPPKYLLPPQGTWLCHACAGNPNVQGWLVTREGMGRRW